MQEKIILNKKSFKEYYNKNRKSLNKLTPEKFLNNLGITLNATSLICYIDGYMRQPDLCQLLENYYNAKLNETIIKEKPNAINYCEALKKIRQPK